jgi:hypothetical protein
MRSLEAEIPYVLMCESFFMSEVLAGGSSASWKLVGRIRVQFGSACRDADGRLAEPGEHGPCHRKAARHEDKMNAERAGENREMILHQ